MIVVGGTGMIKGMIIDVKEEVCANCQHFIQHYIKIESEIVACNAGHCVYPRLKHRSPCCKKCEHFERS